MSRWCSSLVFNCLWAGFMFLMNLMTLILYLENYWCWTLLHVFRYHNWLVNARRGYNQLLAFNNTLSCNKINSVSMFRHQLRHSLNSSTLCLKLWRELYMQTINLGDIRCDTSLYKVKVCRHNGSQQGVFTTSQPIFLIASVI